MSSAPTASRHKPRKMVSLTPGMYSMMEQLARRNGRPITWEIRRAIELALISAGMLREDQAQYVERDDP